MDIDFQLVVSLIVFSFLGFMLLLRIGKSYAHAFAILGLSSSLILSGISCAGFPQISAFYLEPRIIRKGQTTVLRVNGPVVYGGHADLSVFAEVPMYALPRIDVFDIDTKAVFSEDQLHMEKEFRELHILKVTGTDILVEIPGDIRSGLIVVKESSDKRIFGLSETVYITDPRTGFLEVRQ